MLCEKCKGKKAMLKYSQVINGLKVEANLCEDCFNSIKYSNAFINNFFDSFLLFDNYNKNYVCNICGNTFEKFKNTGKMGCANCYNVFRKKLNPIFNNMQENNIHTGKIPKNLEEYKPNIENIEMLKEKLNMAVESEDYEQAIKIRDKIKEIERGMI